MNPADGQWRGLCPEPLSYSIEGLEEAASLVALTAQEMDSEKFAVMSREYEVLLVRLRHRVTGKMIEESPRLRAIISPTTGLDHVDVMAAQRRNVVVFSLQGEGEFLQHVYATAEHTLALLLALLRQVPSAAAAALRGEWSPHRFRGRELAGKRLGILGYGRLGRRVAHYALAFDMHVSAFDRSQSEYEEGVAPMHSLEELLRQADVLTIHVPLSDATRGMIGQREFNLLPRGAWVINTSRGAVIDEGALVEALETGQVAGAALDVLTSEHLVEQRGHPLLEYAEEHSNVIVTPHVGGATQESVRKTDSFVLGKFRRWKESWCPGQQR